MATTINGTTGIDKIQDGTVVDADIASLAASKLTGDLPAGMGGKVLQVVSATYDTQFSTTSSSYATVFNVSITPQSATSTLYITFSGNEYAGSTSEFWCKVRDTTNGADVGGVIKINEKGGDTWQSTIIQRKITSSNTTARTYALQVNRQNGTGTYYFGNNETQNAIATITEVEA